MNRVRLSAPERRQQIIEAAREVFIEQGVNGSPSRMIAQRAGITEAYLYRHFHSKDEIYQAAIEAPLRELIERLRTEIHELSARDDVSRTEVLYHCHELFLESMTNIAPMLTAALFSDPTAGRSFYLDVLHPTFRDAVASIIPDISGWPLEVFELDTFAQGMIGTHLGIAFEALLLETPVDVPATARAVTSMFGPSMVHAGDRSARRGRSAKTATPAKKSAAAKTAAPGKPKAAAKKATSPSPAKRLASPAKPKTAAKKATSPAKRAGR